MFQDKEEYAEEDSCGTTVGGLLNTETGGLTSGATAGKYIYLSTECLKKMVFCGKTAITTFKLIQNAKSGGVLENSGYLLHYGH